MAGESPTGGRRGHYRGRRGDRRGRGRGPGQSQGQGQGPGQGSPPQPAREAQAPRPNRLDVEQIVRELRARVAAERGVELSTTQVAELAARRLEAVLAPGQADQALLARLRESAGTGATRVPASPPLPSYTFGESSLYGSGGGLVRMLRSLLRPLLRLLFDPDPLVQALSTQQKINAELAAREQQLAARQAEWNALLYELVTRTVTENARVSIDVETLAARVEALGAKTEFNERRVRGIEGATHQPRPARTAPAPTASGPAPDSTSPGAGAGLEGDAEGRRRRRRRRGRRGDGDGFAGGAASPQAPRTPAESAEAAVPDAPAPQAAPEAPATSETPAAAAAPAPPGAPERPAPPDGQEEPASKWRQVFSPPPPGGDDSQS